MSSHHIDQEVWHQARFPFYKNDLLEGRHDGTDLITFREKGSGVRSHTHTEDLKVEREGKGSKSTESEYGKNPLYTCVKCHSKSYFI